MLLGVGVAPARLLDVYTALYRAKVMMLRGDAYKASVKIDTSYANGLEYHIKAVAEEPGLENLNSGSGFRPHRAALN